MASYDKDEVPMLSDVHPQLLDENPDSRFQAFVSRTQSASISIPMNTMESYGNEANLVGYTGPLRSERRAQMNQMSGPIYSNRKADKNFRLNHGVPNRKVAESKAEKIPSFSKMDQHDWADDKYTGKNEHLLRSGQLGVCNDPYCTTCPTYYNFKPAEQKHLTASAIFDSKFHNALYGDAKGWATRFTSFLKRYIPGVMNPHTKVVQQWNKFCVICCLVAIFVDPLFFFMLSVQQENKCIVINWPLTTTIIVFRSMTDFIYLLNILLQFRLAYIAPESRVVGAGELVDHPKKIAMNYLCGYFLVDLFIMLPLPQRVNRCLRDACRHSSIWPECMQFIDCGHGNNVERNASNSKWKNWTQSNVNASACFTEDGFSYGIFIQAVNLTTRHSVVTRYVYSLFWGFQQISTLAGNQTPSYFVWEVLFTMAIVGVGLLLFAFLIGNIQNFLQALGRRRLEMSLRRRDVEQWMSHRRLPQELRRKVLEAERYNWAATRGVIEGMLLENLPEDLQRDIRRHLFKFVKKVWIFALMDNHFLDAICERLKQKIYIKGSEILYHGGLVEKMVFIVRGKLESIGEDGTMFPLSEGNVCGEELLTWCLERSSVSKDGVKVKIPGQRLISSRTVRCLSNVEAFSLRAADLEEVTNLFARNLRDSRVQGAIRYESPYWRGLAATRIQVAWRYRQKRLKHISTSRSNQSKI
ncbi:probable cyclic nucleotide-gated ion channel 20, chloroplastic isoform X2 [Ricinus communis]|uniref:probable cyclic nucleotide-gated ion channel 20, chloroplastic isoform X2 n=1 Tax=Ricinus communis TaxID=3988 RepID=UPI0007728A34|nr:probable cyclic nucleotide-gated ion channel 20, chloroplastic isoform X2 [Ricinus communis]|eukprot:XP_015578129.1 probable cyclic nucleotide-gated ion channel 20, chloroplastic isoform X2 [Ricinus communis]